MAADQSIGPGPGRAILLREVLPFLIGNSLELNVQQIHDYVGSAIWKASRANDANAGWKTQPRGSQMGQSWAGWIHIEAGEWAWDDDRPVIVKLGAIPDSGDDGVVQPIVVDVFNGVWGPWPLNPDKPRLQVGSMGDAVLYLQSVIFHRGGGGIARDSWFGTQTERRVRDVQREAGIDDDGRVGRQTWPVVDRLAR